MRKGRSAFTLIEVMVSVVIISTVIMALIKLFANNTHIKMTQFQNINIFTGNDASSFFDVTDFPLNFKWKFY